MDSSSLCLTLPYISKQISDQILKFIKNCGLPMRVVNCFTHQGRSLEICSVVHVPTISQFVNLGRFGRREDCSIICPIYQITCNLCNELYIGESIRSLNDRFWDIFGLLRTPATQAIRMRPLLRTMVSTTLGPGQTPDSTFKLMKTERDTILIKV